MPHGISRSLLLLLAAALCVYFVDLGGSSIWDANEAFYVETPREMIERGDYVFPTFNYEPRLNKPVLSYWIVAGAYHLFGVSVGVQRLPIALAAMVLIACAFFLAREAVSGDAGTRTAAGLWAALGLALSPRLVMFARRIFIDVFISMFLALTLLFFALAERYPARRRLFLVLMYVAIGLGMLTKGPVAAVLPALAFALYLLVHGELFRVRSMMLVPGAAIVLAIVVPWYAALYARDGWTYIVSFFLGENVARYTEGYGVQATRGPLFYLPVVFGDGFPWSVFLIPAAILWFRDRRGIRRAAGFDGASRVRTLLWLWILAIVGFFTLSAAKQDLYVFPIVPAVAALGGAVIARGLYASPESPLPGFRATIAVLGGALLVVGIGVVYVFHGADAVYELRGAVGVGSAAVIGGFATLLLALRVRLKAALLVVSTTLLAVNWIFVLRALPSFEAYKPVPGFARVLRDRLAPDDIVATYDVGIPSLVYYLERHVDMAYDEAPIRVFLQGTRRAFVILPRDDYDRLAPSLARRTCIISSQPTFDVKLRNILARDELPDLVLVTNDCSV